MTYKRNTNNLFHTVVFMTYVTFAKLIFMTSRGVKVNCDSDKQSSFTPLPVASGGDKRRKVMISCDWQTTKRTISHRGRYLLETGQWSDCKFIVGEEPHHQIVEGHKVFLAMASPVFEAMFYGSMAEKSDPILIKDVEPDAFKAFMEYIYTDRVDLGSFQLACELCYCAKKYMLPFLVEECTKFLWSDLSPEKVCRAYEFAKLFEEPVLMAKCSQIICTRTSDVINESSWEDVELNTVLMLLDQQDLQISSETELFCAVERWAKAECIRKSLNPQDEKSLKSIIGNALTKIRFLSLTPKEFAECPSSSTLLSQQEALAILMNISSSESETPMPDGFSLNAQSRGQTLGIETSKFEPPSFVNQLDLFDAKQCDQGRRIHYPNFRIPTSSVSKPLCSLERPARCTVMNGLYIRSSPTLPGEADHFVDPCRNFLEPGNRSVGMVQDVPKYYCTRSIQFHSEWLNTSVLDCSVTFTVDKNICVLGVQVPTQVYRQANIHDNQMYLFGANSQDFFYTEVLYAHLLDSDGTRLTYTHFTTKVAKGSLVEITFNRPVYVQKSKTYRVGVVFNKVGWYPKGICSSRMSCDNVFFTFGVGNPADSVRDDLIISIVFTYR